METDQNRDENFRKLLIEDGEEKVSFKFTESVLKGIEMQLQNQAATELTLKSLLQKHALEQPSANFQLNVIEHLSPKTAIKYKPIISKNAWYGIAAAVAVLLLACYFYPSATPSETPRFLTYLSRMPGYTSKVPDISRGSADIVLATLIGMSILLVGDFFLRQKIAPYNKLARS